MNYSSPIAPPEIPVRHSRKRRRKANHGRFFIFLLFLWLRGIDVAMLHYLYPRLAIVYQHYLVVSVVTTAAWTSGLLIAIWFRQQWAKYLLVASLLITVISTLSMIPGLPDARHQIRELVLIAGITGVYLPVALILMVSRQIHKLTRERGE